MSTYVSKTISTTLEDFDDSQHALEVMSALMESGIVFKVTYMPNADARILVSERDIEAARMLLAWATQDA